MALRDRVSTRRLLFLGAGRLKGGGRSAAGGFTRQRSHKAIGLDSDSIVAKRAGTDRNSSTSDKHFAADIEALRR